MTEQQQKLYDKLLKKVNEYCLGSAAEDVITAIDALVDTYERKITLVFGSRANGKTIMLLNAYEAIKALEIIKKKRVDVQLLKDTKNLNEYNWCVHTKARALTKKTYKLLKEDVLNESTN